MVGNSPLSWVEPEQSHQLAHELAPTHCTAPNCSGPTYSSFQNKVSAARGVATRRHGGGCSRTGSERAILRAGPGRDSLCIMSIDLNAEQSAGRNEPI